MPSLARPSAGNTILALHIDQFVDALTGVTDYGPYAFLNKLQLNYSPSGGTDYDLALGSTPGSGGPYGVYQSSSSLLNLLGSKLRVSALPSGVNDGSLIVGAVPTEGFGPYGIYQGDASRTNRLLSGLSVGNLNPQAGYVALASSTTTERPSLIMQNDVGRQLWLWIAGSTAADLAGLPASQAYNSFVYSTVGDLNFGSKTSGIAMFGGTQIIMRGDSVGHISWPWVTRQPSVGTLVNLSSATVGTNSTDTSGFVTCVVGAGLPGEIGFTITWGTAWNNAPHPNWMIDPGTTGTQCFAWCKSNPATAVVTATFVNGAGFAAGTYIFHYNVFGHLG